MSEPLPGLSPEIRAALASFATASAGTVHRLQVGLAELVLEQAPPAAPAQLEVALAFIEGRAGAGPGAMQDAKQDCWTYVGSLACGCSIADSASAHAIMTCLETDDAAHTPSALAEQAERILRCGVAQSRILGFLLKP